MSFILDALKKADAERHLDQLPGIHTRPLVPVPAPGPAGSRWLQAPLLHAWLLAAAILIGALAWRLLAPSAAGSSPASQQAATQVAVPAIEEATPTAGAASPRTAAAPPQVAQEPPLSASVPPQTASAPPRIGPAPAQIASAPAQIASEVLAPAVVPKPVPTVRKEPVAGAGPAPKAASIAAAPKKPAPPLERTNALTLAQLPPNIRGELPPFAVGGSMYSANAADRMVLVDKRMLHEGDEIAPGLLVESILPKQVLLRYKGFLFGMPL